jgi:diketogulonate reductase-like aldo/keto reductase
VALRWAVQRGTVALPKSVNPGRVVENASIFDFELDASDIATIAALDKDFHFLRPFDWHGVRIASRLNE